MKQIFVWCDGGCDPNPGYGAFAALLSYTDEKGKTHERMVSGTEEKSTNNRAEILAAIIAIEALTQPGQVVVCSDSRYLIQTQFGNWSKNSNLDLWQRLDDAIDRGQHQVTGLWRRGHDGEPGNVRCHNEVTRLLNIHASSELVNTGERVSDDEWLDHTQRMIDAEKRKIERKGAAE